MNKAIIIGRFAADPEIKHTANDVPVTSFTLAVDRPYTKGEKQTDWLDVVAWRSTAEFICKHFSKGDSVIVEGTIQTRNWEDKNGQKRKAVEIVAESVEFVPRTKNSDNAKEKNDEFVPAELDDLPWEM